jgi:hypothetical protein
LGAGNLIANLVVDWHGGLIGMTYSTAVRWIMSADGSSSAEIASDSAPFPVAAPNMQQLADYLQEQTQQISRLAGQDIPERSSRQ